MRRRRGAPAGERTSGALVSQCTSCAVLSDECPAALRTPPPATARAARYSPFLPSSSALPEGAPSARWPAACAASPSPAARSLLRRSGRQRSASAEGLVLQLTRRRPSRCRASRCRDDRRRRSHRRLRSCTCRGRRTRRAGGWAACCALSPRRSRGWHVSALLTALLGTPGLGRRAAAVRRRAALLIRASGARAPSPLSGAAPPAAPG